MKKIIAIAAFAVLAPLAGAAAAQELPGWPTKAACSPGDNWCTLYEAEARGTVAGIWPTLPPEVRGACVTEAEAIEKSYRLLYDCLVNKMQEHVRLGWQQR